LIPRSVWPEAPEAFEFNTELEELIQLAQRRQFGPSTGALVRAAEARGIPPDGSAAKRMVAASRPVEVRPSGVRPSGVRPSGVRPSGVRPSGVRPSGVMPSGVMPSGVMHYFTGTVEDGLRFAEMGFLLSVHTSVTFKNAGAIREVVAQLPLESLVIETDSPYGAPQGYRGKRNEPAYVVEVAKMIAELQGVSVEAVAEATYANACRLFRLPVDGDSLGSDARG
jgi:hypothetical protein